MGPTGREQLQMEQNRHNEYHNRFYNQGITHNFGATNEDLYASAATQQPSSNNR